MSVFVKEFKDAHLKNWLDWWDCRKVQLVFAFRPRNNTPHSNLYGCIHAYENDRDSVDVQLIDAVHDDISGSNMLKEKLKGYAAGNYTGGFGRSLRQLFKASHIQHAKSPAYANARIIHLHSDDVQSIADPACNTS